MFESSAVSLLLFASFSIGNSESLTSREVVLLPFVFIGWTGVGLLLFLVVLFACLSCFYHHQERVLRLQLVTLEFDLNASQHAATARINAEILELSCRIENRDERIAHLLAELDETKRLVVALRHGSLPPIHSSSISSHSTSTNPDPENACSISPPLPTLYSMMKFPERRCLTPGFSEQRMQAHFHEQLTHASVILERSDVRIAELEKELMDWETRDDFFGRILRMFQDGSGALTVNDCIRFFSRFERKQSGQRRRKRNRMERGHVAFELVDGDQSDETAHRTKMLLIRVRGLHRRKTSKSRIVETKTVVLDLEDIEIVTSQEVDSSNDCNS